MSFDGDRHTAAASATAKRRDAITTTTTTATAIGTTTTPTTTTTTRGNNNNNNIIGSGTTAAASASASATLAAYQLNFLPLPPAAVCLLTLLSVAVVYTLALALPSTEQRSRLPLWPVPTISQAAAHSPLGYALFTFVNNIAAMVLVVVATMVYFTMRARWARLMQRLTQLEKEQGVNSSSSLRNDGYHDHDLRTTRRKIQTQEHGRVLRVAIVVLVNLYLLLAAVAGVLLSLLSIVSVAQHRSLHNGLALSYFLAQGGNFLSLTALDILYLWKLRRIQKIERSMDDIYVLVADESAATSAMLIYGSAHGDGDPGMPWVETQQLQSKRSTDTDIWSYKQLKKLLPLRSIVSRIIIVTLVSSLLFAGIFFFSFRRSHAIVQSALSLTELSLVLLYCAYIATLTLDFTRVGFDITIKTRLR